MYNILVCDDEKDIVAALEIYLGAEGYKVFCAYNGNEAVKAVNENDIHLILLDIMMPEKDGIAAMLKIRESSNVPVILLTAKSEDSDKVMGLNVGADDYITKPFSPTELLARVDSLYRRVEMHNQKTVVAIDEIVLGDFTLNLRKRTLLKGGKNIELTQVEFQMVEYFFQNPDVALDRTDILNRVWGSNYFGEEKIVDVNMRRLRKKIEDDPSDPKYLVTVWGMGYKWNSN